jgi:hypothetical protein
VEPGLNVYGLGYLLLEVQDEDAESRLNGSCISVVRLCRCINVAPGALEAGWCLYSIIVHLLGIVGYGRIYLYLLSVAAAVVEVNVVASFLLLWVKSPSGVC